MDSLTIDGDVRGQIAARGFAWVPQAAWSIGPPLAAHWQRLCDDWERLEPDRYLQDGARFRLRRYGRYRWAPANDSLSPLVQEAYFQPAEENSYAGGVARAFAPLLPDTAHNPFLHALVRLTFASLPLSDDRRTAPWEVRVHQIRIVASPGQPGHPAPEGVHQDGTDFLTLHMVRRQNVVGAETTIYDLERRPVFRCTLRDPLDSFILEDPRVLHGVTSVQSADGRTPGTRDLLGIDFLDLARLSSPGAFA
jgi:hypothetical protein